MEKMVSAKNDLVFKKLFTDKNNRNILRGFLSDVLDIPFDSIRDLQVRNSEFTPEEIDQKFTRFDVRLTLDDKLINIEMQVYNYGDFRERSLYYWAQRYGTQLKKGDPYSAIQATISINILNFSLFDHKDYHSVYTMADLEHRAVLTDKCAMHFFELTKLNNTDEPDSSRKRWMRLIKADSEEELDMLTTNTSSPINDCIMALKRYNADDGVREMARRREETIREEISALSYAENKGIKKGIEIGRAEGREEGREEGRAEGRAEGREEGRAEGIAEGIEKGINALLEAMRAAGLDTSQVEALDIH